MNFLISLKRTNVIILNPFFLNVANVEPDFFQPPTLHHTENRLREKAVAFKYISTQLIHCHETENDNKYIMYNHNVV